ncbi:MAG TPA: DNA (cytosine-5-)-methyltransferase [Pyrinomonadaceae bacterium]|nr:DNA (cytosine-5-)-methyltransferase [Pyrinomonadaceae bacterium]HMP65253.1 DNA (cytosine-5-)-methyltransferase [Pyrinomonadaceae bacterium]
MTIKNEKIRVIELFAGVGGFRLGLERASERFEVIWSNQWEPSTKVQHASDIYVKNFGPDGHHNKDITKIPASEIPDHELLVGGFPCQDYSVAKTLNHAKGLTGKKGVLWWEIYRIVEAKKPKYLLLENVDRLLKSPAKQRGRDFAIMLASLSDLGYAVEWRVINAAEYGMPQRRRRVFILAYHKTTAIYADIASMKSLPDWTLGSGLFAKAFPVRHDPHSEGFVIHGELDEISESFNRVREPLQMALFSVSDYFESIDRPSPFENSGVMIDRMVSTLKTFADYEGKQRTLGDVVLTNGTVPQDYFLTSESVEKWEYLKGSKNEQRKNKASGFEYRYTEGPLPFPDPLDRPSRTIITGEGGPSPSRFKHVIRTKEGQLRRLTPVELERLNMFPDNHTAGVSDIRRAFFMGNALVVGIVSRIGEEFVSRL